MKLRGFKYIIQIGTRSFYLKHLFIHKNKVKRIGSNTFKGIERLQSLDLSNNEIVEIEENAFSRNLKLLYLNNNKLKKIHPKCFDNLKSIQLLELYENIHDKFQYK